MFMFCSKQRKIIYRLFTFVASKSVSMVQLEDCFKKNLHTPENAKRSRMFVGQKYYNGGFPFFAGTICSELASTCKLAETISSYCADMTSY